MIDPADRLRQHLASWVGQWPPLAHGVTVVGDPSRLLPTWDGSVRFLQGVGRPEGTVIAVPPAFVDAAAEVLADGFLRDGIGDELAEIFGVGSARFGTGVFRSTLHIDTAIEDVGEWYETQTDELPEWLAPFNGPRLVVRDDATGAVIAGVGIKVHDAVGQELAVVTEEAARGRGLARRLVATAARRVLSEGGVPTYLHEPSNTASARVADAVGFTDQGWKVHGLWTRS